VLEDRLTIDVETSHGGTATISLNAPERLNALDYDDWINLRNALERLAEDPPRLLVLEGVGRAFCAGADRQFLRDLHGSAPQVRIERLGLGLEIALRLIRFPGPTTALVHGACFGVGVSLALACDRVVAAPDSRFGFIFTKLGLPSGDMATTWLVSRRIGTRRAWDLLSSAETVDAERALELGIADEIGGREVGSPPGGMRDAIVETKRQILELEHAYEELDAQVPRQLETLSAAVGSLGFYKAIG
jgi:enoyl-CoA hydratase/carnithine racemase